MDPLRCRRILEVSEDATMEDITASYHLLKRVHEREQTFFSAPSMDEFSPEAREEVLAEIETAYRELSRLHAEAQPHLHPPPPVRPGELPADGPALRRAREATGATLEYLAAQTHVRVEYLDALEAERFWDLPPAAVNVRGFLSAYATELGLPAEDVVPLYMQRFLQWQGRRGR